MSQKNFIRLKMLDIECRCCGKGREYVCEKCNHLMHSGYIVLIEVKDTSTETKKKPTGYAVATLASRYEGTTPGIAFIRQSDLKTTMADEYSNYKQTRNANFLTGAPKPANRGTTVNPRQVVELPVD